MEDYKILALTRAILCKADEVSQFRGYVKVGKIFKQTYARMVCEVRTNVGYHLERAEFSAGASQNIRRKHLNLYKNTRKYWSNLLEQPDSISGYAKVLTGKAEVL